MIQEIRARVILQEKGLYTIACDGREKLAEVSGRMRYEAVSLSDYPAVGDYVLASWPEDGSRAIISSIFPRKSAFIRKAAGTSNQEQVVAANVDIVFICMSLNQNFNLRRLERYLALSWESGAVPVVVLTKRDLCENAEEKIAEAAAVSAGADIISVSSFNDDFDAVSSYLKKDTTAAFLGSSGVGKSTLINRLLGCEALRTSEIRSEDDKGRHTTTHRELRMLACGACVIDTPGMRELGVWELEDGMEKAFSDIEELASGCRFSDCSHKNEPGCAVRRALEHGILDPERWSSYQKLLSEKAYADNGAAYLQTKKQKFKEISKINKKRK